MRMTPKNTTYEPKLDLSSILIQAKYRLWNMEKRPHPDPHVFLCLFLQADRERMSKRATNWCKFRRVCKEIGGAKLKLKKEDVWRSLTLYFVTTKHGAPLSDDESDASCGHAWEKPKEQVCRKLEYYGA